MTGLSFDHVTHAYGDTVAVDDFGFTVEPGEIVCLVGPSGCGKTTVLRIAAGLEPVQQGRVAISSEIVADAARGLDRPPERRGTGLVFQDFALFPHLTVAANVGFGLRDKSAADRTSRVEAILDRLGLARHADAYPHMLSGGQQQRAALARALAPEPRVMLLDEPFSGLDAALRSQIRDQTLHVLKNSGAATLLVTHDPEEAMILGDRIVLMRDGRLIQSGKPGDLYLHPVNAFAAEFFGDVNRLVGTVEAGVVPTPFGPIAASRLADGSGVDVLIRPEALQVREIKAGTRPSHPAIAVASRLLGEVSVVHLEIEHGTWSDRHFHSRMPGWASVPDNTVVDVALDPSRTFVFPRTETT